MRCRCPTGSISRSASVIFFQSLIGLGLYDIRRRKTRPLRRRSVTHDSSIQQPDSCTRNELVCRFVTILAITALGRAATAADLPAKVDLKPQFQDFGLTARQQGNRDDCSLFAVTGVVEYETARHLSKKGERLSEEFLIWAGDKSSGEPGDHAMFWKAVAGLNTYGICSEERMPYGPKTRAQRRPSPQGVRGRSAA